MAQASLRFRLVVLGVVVSAALATFLATNAPGTTAADYQTFSLYIDIRQVIAEAGDLYAFDAPWPPPAGYPDFYLKMVVRDIGGEATMVSPVLDNTGMQIEPAGWDFQVLVAVSDPTLPVRILIGMWESDSPDADDVVDISPLAGDGEFDHTGWKDGTYLVFDYYVYRPGALSDHVYRPNWDSELAYAESTPYLLGGNADGSVGAGGLDAFLLLSITDDGPFTVDTAAPASQVSQLPDTEANPSFPVAWSGTDDKSGIYSYDVQVKAGTTWTNWQTDTSAMSATYTGAEGTTYCFRSRARDNVGNLELWPYHPPQLPDMGDTCTMVAHRGPITVTGSASSTSVPEGGNVTVSAVVKDIGGHDITVYSTTTWSVSPASCGVFWAPPGYDKQLNLSQTAGGQTCNVLASVQFGGWHGTWGIALEVTHAGPVAATVGSSAGSVSEGHIVAFAVNVTDAGGDNLTALATTTWSVSPSECGSVAPSEGSTATFTASTTAGGLNCVVHADSTWGGWWANRTVQVGIRHEGPLAVTVSPTTYSLGEGVSQLFTTAVADAGGQDLLASSTVSWSLSPSDCGSLSATTGASVTFTAGPTARGKSCSVIASATYEGLTASGSAAITIFQPSGTPSGVDLNPILIAAAVVTVAAVVGVSVILRRRAKRPKA